MPFFYSGFHSRYHIIYSCHVSLSFSSMSQFLKKLFFLFLFLMISTILKSTVEFCRKSFNYELYDILLMTSMELHALWRKSTEVKCYSHYILSRVTTRHRWLKQCLSNFPICIYLTVLFGRESLCTTHV